MEERQMSKDANEDKSMEIQQTIAQTKLEAMEGIPRHQKSQDKKKKSLPPGRIF